MQYIKEQCVLIFLVLCLLVAGGHSGVKLLAQGTPAKSNPAPPSATAKPASDPAKASADGWSKVPLTKDEAKDLDYNQLQIENLDFKVENLKKQIMAAKQNLAKETEDLRQKFCKAHDADPAGCQFEVENKILLPTLLVTKPAPAPTPASKTPSDDKE